MAQVVTEATEDDVTGVAGIALFGELLDHLGLVEAADRRNLRPIGPGGYTGGECYRPIVELQLAGGDFLSDVSLLGDEATQRLRGSHALPSHTTLYRIVAGADLGRVSKAMATNRDMLRRAWAMGAAPAPGVLTIDPDATYITTYGMSKEGELVLEASKLPPHTAEQKRHKESAAHPGSDMTAPHDARIASSAPARRSAPTETTSPASSIARAEKTRRDPPGAPPERTQEASGGRVGDPRR